MIPEDAPGANSTPQFVGFWVRCLAGLVDTVLLSVLIYPLLFAIYGADYFSARPATTLAELPSTIFAGPADVFLSWILPAFVII